MFALKKYFLLYIPIFLLFVTVFIWYAVFTESRNGILTVAFLDVGQGDAVFIEAPNGRQVLIDGGPNKKVLRELSKLMPFYDRSIDIVIATHPDSDHVGGLSDVLARFDVDYIFEPGAVGKSGAWKAFAKVSKEKGIQKIIARRGMTIVLDTGVFLTILFPDRDVSDVASNDASIIAQLVYGDTEFLFTGDAPKKIEKYVAALDGKYLKSDVLKVGHHGSKTSTSKIFLGFASPLYAVISAGRDNRYGHPHEEVLDTLAEFEIEIVSTYKNGTLVFQTDGITLRLK